MRVSRALAALCAGVSWIGCGGADEAAVPADAAGAQAAAAQPNANNQPPVIQEVKLTPAKPRPGESVSVKVSAQDPEGEPLSYEYRWRVAGTALDNKSSSYHVESVGRDSSIEVTVIAHDPQGGASEPMAATARVGNQSPQLLQVLLKPLGDVTSGNDITAEPRAIDAENDSIEYRYRWTLNGETLSIEDATLPAKLLKRGDKVVLEVWASDGLDETEPLESAPIEIHNGAPHILSSPGPIGPDGIFRYALRVEDPDGDKSFRYRLLKGPDGMSVGFDDGQVTWDPAGGSAGDHEVELAVEDLFGASTVQKFTLQVAFVTESAPVAKPEPAEAAPED